MNLVVQIGRLVADPETRTTNSGVTVTTFRIAVQRRFKDGNGERQSDFHNCVAWRNQAEFISKYISKGDMICVRGELQNRSYEAQDGTKRYVTEIICEDVKALTSRSESVSAQPTPNMDAQTGFEVAEDDEPLPF